MSDGHAVTPNLEPCTPHGHNGSEHGGQQRFESRGSLTGHLDGYEPGASASVVGWE